MITEFISMLLPLEGLLTETKLSSILKNSSNRNIVLEHIYFSNRANHNVNLDLYKRTKDGKLWRKSGVQSHIPASSMVIIDYPITLRLNEELLAEVSHKNLIEFCLEGKEVI